MYLALGFRSRSNNRTTLLRSADAQTGQAVSVYTYDSVFPYLYLTLLYLVIVSYRVLPVPYLTIYFTLLCLTLPFHTIIIPLSQLILILFAILFISFLTLPFLILPYAYLGRLQISLCQLLLAVVQ